MSKAAPFLKWAGGKARLAAEICRHFPDRFNTYWEPFLGAGGLFFSVDGAHGWHLSDLNRELIATYRALQTAPESVIDRLQRHAARHCERYYYATRSQEPTDPAELAARFIYLNKTCYNGLYRVNRHGKFNVPMGGKHSPVICDAQRHRAASRFLQKATIACMSFEQIEPGNGDLVYCDPPYAGGFTSYTGKGFKEADQVLLRDKCLDWMADGVHVIVSNSNTPLTRKLYSAGFRAYTIWANRSLNCRGGARGNVRELLVVGAAA